jgi:hypothetical protein
MKTFDRFLVKQYDSIHKIPLLKTGLSSKVFWTLYFKNNLPIAGAGRFCQSIQ